jgi:acyl-CoA hydrolase
LESKPCKASLSVKTANILPPDTNFHGTLFGGKLMAYMDDIASIAAARHSRCKVVTASTDSVDFINPVYVGDTICLEAFVTYTHRTSMEVFVKAVTENLLTGERKICATAFLTFVALDENKKPTPVPRVYPETEEEKWLHEGGKERAEHRRKRRKHSMETAEKFGTDLPWWRN